MQYLIGRLHWKRAINSYPYSIKAVTRRIDVSHSHTFIDRRVRQCYSARDKQPGSESRFFAALVASRTIEVSFSLSPLYYEGLLVEHNRNTSNWTIKTPSTAVHKFTSRRTAAYEARDSDDWMGYFGQYRMYYQTSISIGRMRLEGVCGNPKPTSLVVW